MGDLLLAAGELTGAIQVIDVIIARNPPNVPHYIGVLAEPKGQQRPSQETYWFRCKMTGKTS